MSDKKIKEKFPNIKTEEELDEVKKYLFKRACGITLAAIASVCLMLYGLIDFEAGMYWAIIVSLFSMFFFYSSWGHKKLVFCMREDRTQEVITKKMIADNLCGDYARNSKLISLGFIVWTLFFTFIFFKNGTDYIKRNLIIFVVVMAITLTFYIIWLIASKIDADKTKESMKDDNIIILASPLKQKFTSGRYSEFYSFSFESELYGKHSQLVDESEYYLTECGYIYYLILRKAKKKYRLMAIFNPKKWELDEELKNYLVKEVKK